MSALSRRVREELAARAQAMAQTRGEVFVSPGPSGKEVTTLVYKADNILVRFVPASSYLKIFTKSVKTGRWVLALSCHQSSGFGSHQVGIEKLTALLETLRKEMILDDLANA